MGIYANPYTDFPARVEELWKRLEQANNATERDLSVTAMLMVAMAGFASPWEFLKHDNTGAFENREAHPAFDGISQEQYKFALSRVKAEINLPFAQSRLFGTSAIDPWRFGHVGALSEVRRHAEDLWGPQPRKNDNNIIRLPGKARDVLKVLRNALAHGNVCAFMGKSNSIELLVFFSEDREILGSKPIVVGWDVATTKVEAFHHFLTAWFALIREPGAMQAVSAVLEDDDERLAA
ncbi:MAG: hypothetical protein AB1421_06685 [Pseudomonadota bacterium]